MREFDFQTFVLKVLAYQRAQFDVVIDDQNAIHVNIQPSLYSNKRSASNRRFTKLYPRFTNTLPPACEARVRIRVRQRKAPASVFSAQGVGDLNALGELPSEVV